MLIPRLLRRHFTTSSIFLKKRVQLPPRPKVSDDSFEEKFLHGSGPGGQKINKTSSAVQLIHKETGLVIKSQATRSRSQNRKIARNLLAEKLEEMEKGPESRVAKKAELKKKRKASAQKKRNRKYRQLTEEETTEEEGELRAEEGGVEVTDRVGEQRAEIESTAQEDASTPESSVDTGVRQREDKTFTGSKLQDSDAQIKP